MDDDARQGDLHHPSRSEAADACGRTILDCITDPIFACDADWRLIYLNAGAALLFGAAPEAILGRRAGDLLPRAEAGVLEAVFRRAAGRVCEGEIDRTALGRHLLLRCFPCPEGGLCVHCQDITDRRAHEQALQTSAEQYRSVVEDQNEIICRHRPGDGCYTFVNRGFCRFFGRSREELLGRAWHAEAVPEDRPLIRTLLARISPEHPVVTVENRVYDRDGQIRWLQVDNRGIFDERDRLVEIQAVGRDITDRKQMELQLRRAEASARNLFEVNLDPLLIIGVDGRIVDINRASTKASGYTREEIVGSDFRAYVVDRDQALAGFWRVFEEGAVRDLPLDIRYRDGRVVPTLCNAALLHEEDGQVAGILVSVHNITELKQAEEELKAINAELERRVEARTHELQETQKKYLHAEKLSAIGQLSASIAHEFNNPLQGIMTVLKGLYRRAVLEPEDRALLAMAIDESERMKDLIRSLQDFNRPSSGLRGRMDLHACLDSLLLFQKSDLKNKRIEIERDYAPDLPPVMAVADQVKQVLLNLLTNAADACQQPGCTITARTRREGERVAIAISDTGVGIRPEEMGSLFQPFYTTKAAVKGTGLGLSVSWGIVRNHGGEIRVESVPGKGSTFTVLLPIEGGGPRE